MKRDEKGLNGKSKQGERSYFGGCPVCGETDGYLNIGRDHWFVCHAHRMRWWAGSNLFSTWRYETHDEWQENAARIERYTEVTPDYEG